MEELVHIIPLGYEIDRVVKPFEGPNGFRANRVYLLSAIGIENARREVRNRHNEYVKIVKRKLEDLSINVIVVPTTLINLLDVISKVSDIICKEKLEGNIVYINMSGAGRLTSVGATLAGMVHGVKIYYVESDEYADNDPRMDEHGYTIVKDARILHLKNFKIKLPDEVQIKILVEISRRKKMMTIDIIDYLHDIGEPGFDGDYYSMKRTEKTAIMMKLNRRILDEIELYGYVIKYKIGRENEYVITEAGEYVARISGLYK